MKSYLAYFFDLYGTLADIHTDEDRPALWRFLAEKLAAEGAVYTPAELKRAWQQAIEADLARALRSRKKVTCPEADIAAVFRSLYEAKSVHPGDDLIRDTAWSFRQASTTHLRLYAGAKELLTALRQSGRKVYLLSNAQRLFTEPELQMLGIRDLFDGIFISSDYGVKKPDLLFYQAALKECGLQASECLMTGNDLECDILGARAAGLDTFYILSGLSPRERKKTYEKDRRQATFSQRGMDLQNLRRIIL